MALGDPIFAGENEGQQLYVIASLLGPPPHDMVKRSPKKSIFFTADGMQFLSSCQNFRKAYRPYPPEANILKLLGACVSQTFADFVEVRVEHSYIYVVEMSEFVLLDHRSNEIIMLEIVAWWSLCSVTATLTICLRS